MRKPNPIPSSSKHQCPCPIIVIHTVPPFIKNLNVQLPQIRPWRECMEAGGDVVHIHASLRGNGYREHEMRRSLGSGHIKHRRRQLVDVRIQNMRSTKIVRVRSRQCRRGCRGCSMSPSNNGTHTIGPAEIHIEIKSASAVEDISIRRAAHCHSCRAGSRCGLHGGLHERRQFAFIVHARRQRVRGDPAHSDRQRVIDSVADRVNRHRNGKLQGGHMRDFGNRHRESEFNTAVSCGATVAFGRVDCDGRH